MNTRDRNAQMIATPQTADKYHLALEPVYYHKYRSSSRS